MRHTLVRMLAACVLALTSYVGSIGLPLVTAGPVGIMPHAHQALSTSVVDPNAIVIGLNADMSAWAAEAGESIRRGIVLALEEINRDGGLLGRPVQLVVRDNQGNPTRGVDDLEAFAHMDNLVAVMGGVQSIVVLEQLPMIHQHRIPLLLPWASITPLVRNGYEPNFVFRVSARDEYIGEFFIQQALRMGYKRPGLLVEQTAFGASNAQHMVTALQKRSLSPIGIEKFYRGVKDVTDVLETFGAAGMDVLLLVASPLEGSVAVQSMAALPEDHRVPIIAHWGITASGKRFYTQVQGSLPKVDLAFMQTFSFLDAPFPERAQHVLAAYCATFTPCQSPRDVLLPIGTAQAYDLIHLLALAVKQANSLDRTAIRDALEHLGPYAGLLRQYNPPFTVDKHDALDITDLRLARYDTDGTIIPVPRGQ
jgi:branched-chain amino acid transport system substrate-binding protein